MAACTARRRTLGDVPSHAIAFNRFDGVVRRHRWRGVAAAGQPAASVSPDVLRQAAKRLLLYLRHPVTRRPRPGKRRAVRCRCHCHAHWRCNERQGGLGGSAQVKEEPPARRLAAGDTEQDSPVRPDAPWPTPAGEAFARPPEFHWSGPTASRLIQMNANPYQWASRAMRAARRRSHRVGRLPFLDLFDAEHARRPLVRCLVEAGCGGALIVADGAPPGHWPRS